jgi:Glyoxalase/Bleomycin resistance protein/Dioxygenase superfamily
MAAVLDHLALGTTTLTDGWELFGAVLGGTWVYGGDSAGFWWGQLEFAAGPKIELLKPAGGPDSEFLGRFLARHGAGPHHFNFLVTSFDDTLARIRAIGLEPVGVDRSNPHWLEGFLHPRDAHGIVVQIAQQGGPPPPASRPELPAPGLPARFELIEHHVSDLDAAVRLFRDVLDGQPEPAGTPETAGAATAELSWPGGKRIRLVHEDGLPRGGALHHVRFARAEGTFSPQDHERARLLAGRLGLAVELSS